MQGQEGNGGTTDADLRAAVDALGDAIAVLGCGPAGRAAVEELEPAETPADPETRTLVAPSDDEEAGESDVDAEPDDDVAGTLDGAASALVAVELGTATELAESLLSRAREDGVTGIALAAVPESGAGRAEWRALNDLRDAADAVLLVPASPDGDHTPAAAGLLAALQLLLGLVERVGVVNLDLADVHTVLAAGDLALLARGHAEESADPSAVVERTIERAPRGFGLRGAPTVLVHIICGPALSVTTAGAVVDAVREQVATDAHIIWGATIDDSLADEALGVELVVGGVVPAVKAGDPCPRCGATIVEYTLGDHSTVACDACGYAGVTTTLR